jgi:hypothetical protein
MTLISDLQYFPPFIFYYRLSTLAHCVFEQYDAFQKMSFRNRCTLLGPNGVISLSIPIVGGREQKNVMKDIKIDHRENWRARHWKTITSCYNRSPWLDHYRSELENLYSKKTVFLVDWNLECFRWVCDKMAIKVGYSLTGSLIPEYDKGLFLDERNQLKPSTINQKYPDVKKYPQVFEDRFGFVPNLSILDYLFCNGNKLKP